MLFQSAVSLEITDAPYPFLLQFLSQTLWSPFPSPRGTYPVSCRTYCTSRLLSIGGISLPSVIASTLEMVCVAASAGN